MCKEIKVLRERIISQDQKQHTPIIFCVFDEINNEFHSSFFTPEAAAQYIAHHPEMLRPVTKEIPAWANSEWIAARKLIKESAEEVKEGDDSDEYWDDEEEYS